MIRSAWIGKFDIFHSPRLLLSKKRDETYTQRDQEGAQNSNSVAPPGFSRKFVFCFRQILFIRKYVTFWRNNHNINMKIYALRETKKVFVFKLRAWKGNEFVMLISCPRPLNIDWWCRILRKIKREKTYLNQTYLGNDFSQQINGKFLSSLNKWLKRSTHVLIRWNSWF